MGLGKQIIHVQQGGVDLVLDDLHVNRHQHSSGGFCFF
jgi:hypothetical protein